ncbi:MAG: DedA family protein [Holosporales bacterium]|jgi:membrane protein DedA with SNARE-associated domain|nr:DedA family protein [Holosporales bacterium]
MLEHKAIFDFIRDWGYLAVLLGSIFEGEVILITASAFAALGHLSIVKIFFLAFVTTVAVDQAMFWIGYEVGTDWLVKKFPRLEKPRARAFSLLHKMDILFIFAFRFIYGIRTVSPLIIGSAKIKPSRFIVFNILSGLVWSFVGCFLGYTIADVVIDGEFNSSSYSVAIPIIIAIVFCLFMLFMKIRKK